MRDKAAPLLEILKMRLYTITANLRCRAKVGHLILVFQTG